MLNPYFLISVGYLSVVLLYQLGWSELYPPLSLSLGFFLAVLIIFSGIAGFVLRKQFRRRDAVKFSFSNLYTVLAVVVVIGTLIDGAYSGGFPIFGAVDYSTFGLKTIHPLIQFLAAMLSYMSVSALMDDKRHRLVLVGCIVIGFMPFVVALSRGMIFTTGMVSLLILLSRTKLRQKKGKLIPIFLVIAVGIFLFGILGNIRLNYQVGNNGYESAEDSSLIMDIGSANEKFRNSSVPKTFFWTYVYGTSPLANLQTTINNKYVIGGSVKEFIVTQWLPDYVSKKMYPNYANSVKSASANTQVSVLLTTGGIFLGPYIIFGWYGLFFMIVFLIVFPAIYLILLKKLAPGYLNIGLAILATIYVMSVFDNMFSFSGLSLQLLIVFVFGLFDRRFGKTGVNVNGKS